MTFASLAWKNLSTRRARTGLAIAGVSVGVAATGLMFSFVEGFQKSFSRSVLSGESDAIVMRLTARNPFPSTFSVARAEQLGAVPGVKEAVPALLALLQLERDQSLALQGVPTGSFLWRQRAPSSLSVSAEDPAPMLLGASAAALLQKKPGDVIESGVWRFRVAGVFEAADPLETASSLVPLDVLQRLTGQNGQVNLVHLRLEEGWDENTLAGLREILRRRFRGLQIFQAGELAGNLPIVQMAGTVAAATSALMLGIGVLLVTNCLLMSVTERRREIAILRALGWRETRVAGLLIMESLAICFCGALAGAALTLALGRAVSLAPNWFGGLVPSLNPLFPIYAAGLSAVCALLASLYPVLKACRMPPASELAR